MGGTLQLVVPHVPKGTVKPGVMGNVPGATNSASQREILGKTAVVPNDLHYIVSRLPLIGGVPIFHSSGIVGRRTYYRFS